MKVYYLSTMPFAQVDKEILHHLVDDNDLMYGVMFTKSVSNFTNDEIKQYCIDNGIAYQPHFLPYRQRDLRSFKAFYAIIKAIKQFNPDVIYIVAFDHPVFSILSFLLDPRKTIVAVHDVELHGNFPNAKFHKIGKNLMLNHFSNFQVFSKNQADLFRRKYKYKALYTIPLALGDYGNADVTRKYDKIGFLFFGNILEYKGLKLLLRAVNRLAEISDNFELIIAGKCDLNEWQSVYEPLIKHPSVINKKIRFIDNNEVSGLFLNAHYLILPYSDATQSGPLMIAYNYNIPVVASDIEAFREFVIEDKTGYLFENKSEDQLYLLLENLLKKSESEYETLSKRLKKVVAENYSKEVVVKMYNRMFEAIKDEA